MIETGLHFGSVHSFYDLDLILSSVEIPPATPKETFVDIPGADGSVDMTEAHGEVKFADRTGAKFTFYMNPAGDLSDAAWEAKKQEISNLLNGKKTQIRLDKDPDYFWQGRCKVDSFASDKRTRKIVVGARLAPYKLKNDMTRVFIPFCGKNLLDMSEANQLKQLYGSVEYIPNGVRKSGSYFVGFTAFVNTNTTYFLSVNIKKITGAFVPTNGGRIAIYDKDVKNHVASFGSTEGNAVFTFNSGKYTEIAVLFYSDSNDSQGVYEFTNVQLEAGKATEYEPFAANTDPQEVILTNSRKTVCPTIICTGETTLKFSGGEVSLGEGTHKVLDLQLYEGETPVTVSGAGAVTFVYQEGDL